MAGEIIRKGDRTDHGGTVLEGSLTDICHGMPIAFIGHRVQCPKCKGTYPIVEGVLTTTIFGKGVAIAGMKTACGGVLIPSQYTDIVEVAGGSSPGESRSGEVGTGAGAATEATRSAALAHDDASPKEPGKKKSVKRIYWSYGEGEKPIDAVSRHYVDLNLHIEIENYAAGENVEILLKNDDDSDLISGVRQLLVQAKVDSTNTACIRNVFGDKTIEIGMIS